MSSIFDFYINKVLENGETEQLDGYFETIEEAKQHAKNTLSPDTRFQIWKMLGMDYDSDPEDEDESDEVEMIVEDSDDIEKLHQYLKSPSNSNIQIEAELCDENIELCDDGTYFAWTSILVNLHDRTLEIQTTHNGQFEIHDLLSGDVVKNRRYMEKTQMMEIKGLIESEIEKNPPQFT